MPDVQPGLASEVTAIVDENTVATAVGSGTVAVYATPAMLALMEAAAVAALAPVLPEGQSSVGIGLELEHVAATPAGERVRAQAEVTEVQERTVTFLVQAWDEHELIGTGTHVRYIIDTARFMRRVEAKRRSLS